MLSAFQKKPKNPQQIYYELRCHQRLQLLKTPFPWKYRVSIVNHNYLVKSGRVF